jgi:hypothetical protein
MLVKFVKGIKMFIFSDEEKNQVYQETHNVNQLSAEEKKLLNKKPVVKKEPYTTTPFKVVIILIMFVSSCKVTYVSIYDDCNLDPTVTPPGKTWKQVQDSCKTKIDY